MNDVITIVTVCYNCKKDIEKTLLSVINQDYSNIEYIVIDGGSTDGTLDIISKYKCKISKFISEPDKGIYDAMNKAIDMAAGKWINFLNAGDIFVNKCVISDFFKKAKEIKADFLYGDVILSFPFGNYYRNCKNTNWCHQSLFTNTALMKKYKFDISYRITADEHFVNTALNDGALIKYVPCLVSVYESYNGVSSNHIKLYIERARTRNIKKGVVWYMRLLLMYVKEILRGFIYHGREAQYFQKLKKLYDANPLYHRVEIDNDSIYEK